MSISNLTLSNVKKVKNLLFTANKNEPGSVAWNNAESTLADLIRSFWEKETPKQIRLKYYSSGIFELLSPIIKADVGKHTNRTLENVWSLIECGMDIPESNDVDNIETLTKGVHLGFIELAVYELRFRPLRCDGKLMERAFMALANPALFINFTNRLVASGAPLACLELIREGANVENETMRSNLIGAMRTLTSIARFDIDPLLGLPSLVDVVQSYLPLLRREGGDGMIILLGFFAARLLLRVYGKDSHSKVILENPIIPEFYPKVMRKLMDIRSGKSYNLYRAYWKLANIAFDLSIISRSDDNKQLLVPIVPLMLEMMALHHNGDRDVLRYGVVFLLQISSNKSCLNELKRCSSRVKVIQGIILSDKGYEKETLSVLADVMNVV
jgi:hypothetical protein